MFIGGGIGHAFATHAEQKLHAAVALKFVFELPGKTQIASTQIDGRLGQSVAGLGVYMWLDDHFYAELAGYTAAVVGGSRPLDSTQSNVAHGVSPYWPLAYEQRWDRNSISVGTFTRWLPSE